MKLMYKQYEACRINIKTGEVYSIDNRTFPCNLYLEEDNTIDARVNNITNMNHWLASRVLSLDRENAKAILNSCSMKQAITDKDRALVAMQYRALSLQDSYWVEDDNEEIAWDKINLFDNSLSNAVVDISLLGRNLTITNSSLIAPDCSTAGVFAKAWVRNGETLWLYKGDKDDSVRKEVEASEILRLLGLDVVEYRYGEWKGHKVSMCKLFTTKDIGYVTAEEYAMNNELPMRGKEYYTMILADYLVGNSDRHCGNWGYMTKANSIIGFAPIFDFNHAFEANEENICKPEQLYGEAVSEIEAASRALKVVEYRHGVSLRQFKYGEFTEQRIAELEAYMIRKASYEEK